MYVDMAISIFHSLPVPPSEEPPSLYILGLQHGKAYCILNISFQDTHVPVMPLLNEGREVPHDLILRYQII